MGKGASLRDRAGPATPEAPAGLRHPGTITGAEVTKLPQEAIDAWVEYEPPEIQSNNPIVIANGVMRHAFMSGFLAAQRVEGEKEGPA